MNAVMADVDVTWSRALKVFWSAGWRFAVFVLAPGLLIGTIVHDVLTRLFVDLDTALPVSPATAVWLSLGALGFVFVMLAGTSVTKIVLAKAFSDFRIVLEGPPKRYRIEPRMQNKASPGSRGIRPAPTIDANAAAAAVRQHGVPREPRLGV